MNDKPSSGETAYNLPHAQIAGCALVQDLIPLYIDGEVSPNSHALIADHLERCEHCSGFLAGARSVRTQILDEESKVRAAFAAAPAVAAVQQPVWSSPLATLWRFAMLIVWLGALAITLAGIGDGAPQALLIGGFGTLAAIGGLLIAGGEQRPEWRIGMLLTGLLGVFCVGGTLLGLFSYIAGPVLLGGLMQIAIAAWGLWPLRPRELMQLIAGGSGQPGKAEGSSRDRQPMLAALLSLAGAALSAGLLLAGIAMVNGAQSTYVSAPAIAKAEAFAAADVQAVIEAPAMALPAAPDAMPALPIAPAAPVAPAIAFETVDIIALGAPRWEPLLVGMALIGAGTAGLLVIAARRGWLPRELRSLTPRHWLGYGLVGGGLLWLSFALRALLAGLLPSLPSIGVAAALLLFGWALARRQEARGS